MALGAGLVAKGAIALGVVGVGATGIYFAQKYLNFSFDKYDLALINFLSHPENDIVFDVKKGDSASQDLTEGDIKFSDNQNEKITVLATVKVSGTSTNNSHFKKNGNSVSLDDQTMKEIKALNGGNWTWKCKLSFSRGEEKTVQEIDEQYKKRIFATGDKGLFGILKKDVSNYTDGGKDKWTKQELKDVKKKFVAFCGAMRLLGGGVSNTSEDSTIIETNVLEFKFTKNNNNKLVPSNAWKSNVLFDKWFGSNYGTKDYNTSSSNS